MQIREAVTADIPEILAIYNDIIATSTAVYRDQPMGLEDMRIWVDGRVQKGLPVLVASDGLRILGFASYADWRSAPCYRHTVEHTVHVAATARGQGIGSALMAALFPRAVKAGMHVMIGGIDAANAMSLKFHERLGFSQAARMEQVGRKFDRWLDLVFVHKFLDQAV